MQAQAKRASTVGRSALSGRMGFAHPVRNVASIGVERGMTIADFGAGSGHYTLQFAESLQGTGCVYAIDVQSDLLRRIQGEAQRRGLKNITVITGDVERPGGTKLADRSLDLVLISNVLFQLEEQRAALQEAWRILKPSGRLAIIDWSESFGGMGPRRQHVIPKEKAIELANACGFSKTDEFEAGDHHYGLMLKPSLPSRV